MWAVFLVIVAILLLAALAAGGKAAPPPRTGPRLDDDAGDAILYGWLDEGIESGTRGFGQLAADEPGEDGFAGGGGDFGGGGSSGSWDDPGGSEGADGS